MLSALRSLLLPSRGRLLPISSTQSQLLVHWETESLFTCLAWSCDLGVGVGVEIRRQSFGGKKETSGFVSVADN